jgi:membrane associated rhomboid family serine protease
MTHPAGRPTSTPVPWLSGLLVAAFAVFSVLAHLRHEQVTREGVAALDAAREYFLAHPYLEPGAALSTRLEEATLQQARSEFAQRQAASGIPTPEGVIRRQQVELDETIQRAIASVGELPAQRVAFVPRQSPAYTWLAYPLLHVGNAVLIGNGLLLIFFGLYLERSFGAAAYAGLLVFLTLAGAAGWSITAPQGATHGLVGSTPLVAGLAAAFAASFIARRGEGFYIAGLVVAAFWILLPPWATAAWSFAGLELVPTQPAPPPTAVYFPCLASIAAAAIACTMAWLLGIGADTHAEGSAVRAQDPRLRRVMRARAAGRPREALELLAQHLATEPDHYEAAVAAWEVSRELGRDAEITASLLRVIRIELRRGLSAAALDHWLDLARGGIPDRTDPALLLQMALLLRENDHQSEAVRALRCALERSDDRANHVLAARIARAARGLDPGTTETAAWRALGSAELSLAERQSLEDLIGEVLATPAARAASLARIAAAAAPAVSAAAAAPAPAVATSAPAETAPAAAPRPAAIEIETSQRVLDAVLAVPLELAGEGVEIQTSQGQKKLVRYERIEAVAVAAVHGIAAKPVILVDLVLNWMTPKNETLRVIRMRGDQFDPRRLLAGQTSPTEALRAFVKTLLDRSNAIALPDPEAALGRPFVSFEELPIYQRAVLLVEGPAEPRVQGRSA